MQQLGQFKDIKGKATNATKNLTFKQKNGDGFVIVLIEQTWDLSSTYGTYGTLELESRIVETCRRSNDK